MLFVPWWKISLKEFFKRKSCGVSNDSGNEKNVSDERNYCEGWNDSINGEKNQLSNNEIIMATFKFSFQSACEKFPSMKKLTFQGLMFALAVELFPKVQESHDDICHLKAFVFGFSGHTDIFWAREFCKFWSTILLKISISQRALFIRNGLKWFRR